MPAHAILSPSGASRWLSCTPSARLEQQFADSSGDAAKEGTTAHALGELLIREKAKLISKAKAAAEIKKIEADKYYDEAMHEYAEDYALYVMEAYITALAHTKGAKLFIEKKLDLTDYIEDGFGTGDTVIVADAVMNIIDLKYGKGVPVSAENNKQMMVYAIGALKDFDMLYDIDTIQMTIYQPRIDNISVWEISRDELFEWAENELKPKAVLAFAGEGEFVAGDHCRFCRAKGLCKANAEKNLELAKYDFKAEGLLTDEEVSDILNRADTFKKWIAGVEEHALNEAVNNGKKWPEYKLVAGRSVRVITDEQQVLKVLTENAFYEKEKLVKPEALLGITKLEKIIGKADFETFVNDYIQKPQGKPTLVHKSDKRPEYNGLEQAKLDFQ